ncbi:Uncharacterised protein [Staphylococcus petrasii]|nr:Uncharacterised protein [Staphylococcus petrasii]
MERSSAPIRPLHFFILMMIIIAHLPEMILNDNKRII